MNYMYQMTMERVRRETYNEFCERYVSVSRLFNAIRTKYVGTELYGTVTISAARSEYKDAFDDSLKIFMELFCQQKY